MLIVVQIKMGGRVEDGNSFLESGLGAHARDAGIVTHVPIVPLYIGLCFDNIATLVKLNCSLNAACTFFQVFVLFFVLFNIQVNSTQRTCYQAVIAPRDFGIVTSPDEKWSRRQ